MLLLFRSDKTRRCKIREEVSCDQDQLAVMLDDIRLHMGSRMLRGCGRGKVCGWFELLNGLAGKTLLVEGRELIVQAGRCKEVALEDLLHLVPGRVIAFNVDDR